LSIYKRTLYQPYSVHVGRNSSEIISGIAVKTYNVINIIVMAFSWIGATVMLTFILSALIAVEPMVALTVFGGFGAIYWTIDRLTKRTLQINSQKMAYESTQVIKVLQEGLGGIRDILIDGNQETICEVYRKSDLGLRHAQGSSAFIGASPKFVMESLAMLLITGLAYVLTQQPAGIARAVPILGAIAFGAQRLLPLLQQAYGSLSVIRGGQASLQDALDLLDQPLPAYVGTSLVEVIPFADQIHINNVSFRYSAESAWVLERLDLKIKKGSRIGFIGTTGSGKSTLLDIVMGLLPATEGQLEVDGLLIDSTNPRGWQAHVAHVPQNIFLTDASIEQNIAFGVEKGAIDHNRVVLAAQQAQIADIIETWPQKYQTFVGERGVRLSGGQRQRIAIARALYKQADVFIFDEATSALDGETELAVMKAIESLSTSLTILIIAHRLTTLRHCDQIVELGGGGICRIGSYQEMVSNVTTDAGSY